jgi:biopolymer transport protein ExbB
MWQILRAGGPVMIPLGLCSLLGLAVLIERLLALRRRRVVLPEIVGVVETLGAGTDFSVANAILDRNPGPFANVVRAGLSHATADWLIIRDALQEAGRQEAAKLTRNLYLLETVAAASPLLGLLGTVTGLIRLFHDIAGAGIGNPTRISGGIAEAMIATTTGLVIGIPALVLHNWLQARAEGIIFDLEVYAAKVLDTLRTRAGEAAARIAGGG